MGSLIHIINRYASIPFDEGDDKVMSMESAVRRFVRPGMVIHLASTHSRPNALMNELIRAFDGKKPDFTIVILGFISNCVILVHTGLVKRIISSFIGDPYPSPSPNPIIQKAYKEGRLEIENWSILSFTQRLMAGAMGIPFMPTRSIIGSSMEKNSSFFTIERDGEITGMVQALLPDIALIHALAGDRSGNLILTPPYGGDVYGALASKHGVIASVENIVSTEIIRRNSHLVRIPNYIVRAVCPVRFGAHPSGLTTQGIEGFESYADDYEFLDEVRLASRDTKTMDEWIKEWATGVKGHDQYLEKLSSKRLQHLRERAKMGSWLDELGSIDEGPPRQTELMVIAGAKKICERIKKGNYRTILAGIGVSNLASWLSYYRLRNEGYSIDLMAEVGFYGYVPRPADPFIFNLRNAPTCKHLSNVETIMGIFMGGEHNNCIGVIGAGEIDKLGNINTTIIGESTYLTGSGGANDVCSSAREVVVTAFQDRRRFVEKVDYITSPGRNVRTLISDLGIFERGSSNEPFILTGYIPSSVDQKEESALRLIKERCGWELMVSNELKRADEPDPDEVRLLRAFDPKGQFLSKA